VSAWPTVSLTDVAATIETGKRPKGGAVDAGIPSLGGEHVSGDGSVNCDVATFVPEPFFRDLKKGVLADGDILIVKDGATTGRTGFLCLPSSQFQAAANEHVFIVRTDESRCMQSYAYHLLRSAVGNRMVLSDFRGAAQGGISRGFADRVVFPLPPLNEQRRIVGLLDRAAEIRRRANAARGRARAIIPALFLDTFGDPATNPKGWRSVELDDLCDLVRGSSPRPQGDRRFFGGPVPRLMISDITRDGTYVTPRTDSLTIEGAARSRPMKAEDVVMAVSGAVGLPAILAIDACIHDGFVGFRNLRKDVTAQYFYYYLLVSRRASQSQAVGATFQNLNTDQIRRWIVPIPPEKHQRIFTETAQRLDSLARHLDAAAAKAEAMVAGLSAEMFG
jgi:restriction endonuclease S subunit